MDKKGTSMLTNIILTIVFVGVIMGILFLMLAEFQENQSDNIQTTIVNETFDGTSGIGYLTYNSSSATHKCYSSLSITTCINSTGGEIVPSTNYSVTTSTGAVTTLVGGYNYTTWNCTYTATHGGDGCNAIVETSLASGELPQWLDIIVIVLIASIIIGLVLKFTKGETTTGV